MIHILWCTIRPYKFIEMHSEWLNRSNNKDNIKTYIATNNTQDTKFILNNYDSVNYVLIRDLNISRIGVCYPSYVLSSEVLQACDDIKDNDIVILASDDFLPPYNWDVYLINKFNEIGKDCCLMIRDGYQLPDSSNMIHPAITIPIMNIGCLKRLNWIIYHPEYNHMFSDCELYDNLKDLNMLYDDRLADETIFEHLHYAASKRVPDFADIQYSNKWKSDEFKWNLRRIMSVEERLIVKNNGIYE